MIIASPSKRKIVLAILIIMAVIMLTNVQLYINVIREGIYLSLIHI